jgi:hypothetical protein
MFSQFITGYKGNPEQEARQMIQNANLNQAQLNKIQSSANMIYGMAQKFGIFK